MPALPPRVDLTTVAGQQAMTAYESFRAMREAAVAMEKAYLKITAGMLRNPYKLSVEQARAGLAAWLAENEPDMTLDKIDLFGSASKALLNMDTPGRIVDGIPEAVITIPQA